MDNSFSLVPAFVVRTYCAHFFNLLYERKVPLSFSRASLELWAPHFSHDLCLSCGSNKNKWRLLECKKSWLSWSLQNVWSNTCVNLKFLFIHTPQKFIDHKANWMSSNFHFTFTFLAVRNLYFMPHNFHNLVNSFLIAITSHLLPYIQSCRFNKFLSHGTYSHSYEHLAFAYCVRSWEMGEF